jgi:hypothetical protein
MRSSIASQDSATAMTDSPWFWCYAFATVGLGLLVLVGPKWIERQVGLDQRARGIRHSLDQLAANETEVVTQNELGQSRAVIEHRWRRQFRMLVGILAIVLSAAWIVFFSQRRRSRRWATSGQVID